MKERISRVNDALIEIYVDLTMRARDVIKRPTKGARIYAVMCVIAGFLGANPAMAVYATPAPGVGGDIFAQLEGIMGSLYGKIFVISSAVAALSILVGLVIIMLSPSAQGSRPILSWIKKVVIAWICIQCLGAIFALLRNLTGDGASSLNAVIGRN